MIKHTAGPWQALPYRIQIGDCVESHQIWGGPRIAFIEEQNVGKEQAEANARLIAASPKLYEACRMIVAATSYEEIQEAKAKADEAIAEVELP